MRYCPKKRTTFVPRFIGTQTYKGAYGHIPNHVRPAKNSIEFVQYSRNHGFYIVENREIHTKYGAASQIRTGDLILTNFECKLLMECLLMPADALQVVEIQHFSQSAAIPKLYQSERPNCWL